MGIYIKGMEMPTSCHKCPLLYVTSICDGSKECPLTHITPHGRLIDADALKEFFPDKGEGSWTYNIVVSGIIRDAPTVIEAEDGDNDV